MTASIIGQAAPNNTNRVAALPPPTAATRAAAREPNAMANTAILTQAYHRDKGASALANYKSYGEDGQPRLFFQDGSPANTQPSQTKGGQSAQIEGAQAMQNEPVVCETCANRKYQDVSDDAGVSFQTATHVSAQASVSAVTRHEREHVARETRDAAGNDQKAITSVRIFMDRCPECGTWYASGGLTKITKISEGNKAGDMREKDKEKAANAS